jgi:hypothetical protein
MARTRTHTLKTFVRDFVVTVKGLFSILVTFAAFLVILALLVVILRLAILGL